MKALRRFFFFFFRSDQVILELAEAKSITEVAAAGREEVSVGDCCTAAEANTSTFWDKRLGQICNETKGNGSNFKTDAGTLEDVPFAAEGVCRHLLVRLRNSWFLLLLRSVSK